MVLQKDGFVAMLRESPGAPDADAVLDAVVSKAPPEKRQEAKEVFHLLMRVMKAKNTDELSDVPVQDILKCFQWMHVFEEIFMAEKAGELFQTFHRNFQRMRTKRKVRVL